MATDIEVRRGQSRVWARPLLGLPATAHTLAARSSRGIRLRAACAGGRARCFAVHDRAGGFTWTTRVPLTCRCSSSSPQGAGSAWACGSCGSTASCSTSSRGATSRCATSRPYWASWAVLNPVITMVVFTSCSTRSWASSGNYGVANSVSSYLRGAAAVEPVLGRAAARRHEPGRQRQPAHQGLLPAPRHPDPARARRPRRLPHSLSSCWWCSWRPTTWRPPGTSSSCRSSRCSRWSRRWPSSCGSRPERALPRRPVHHPVPHSALDVPVAGRLSHVPHRTGTKALIYSLNPMTGVDRRLPLGAGRPAGAGLACSGVGRPWWSWCWWAASSTSGAWNASSRTSSEHAIAASRSRPGQAVPDRRRAAALRHAARRHHRRRHSAPRRLRHAGLGDRPREHLWALRDVTLRRRTQGEVVGVIGRNGAGKSTLLKILSRITEPTDGRRSHMRGRVGSLLEVGTGFHPELTGRENIYLNGAILGMTRAEIGRKFDEIVEFSEIARVPRHAGQALLQRHVRAPRLRRGRPPRARDPARRRGAGGRRRRLPAQVPRPDGGRSPARAAPCCS